MKKKALTLTMALTLSLSTGITAFAAPVATGDGGVFDADYYADNNPDVEAAYGRDFNLLWQHFTTYGVNEGRLPFAPGTDWQAILAAAGQTTDVQTEIQQQPVEDIAEETRNYAVWDVEYPLTFISTDTNTPISGFVEFFSDSFAFAGDPIEGHDWLYQNFGIGANDENYDGNVSYYWSFNAKDSSEWVSVDYQDVAEYTWDDAADCYWKFNITYNGKEYPAIAIKYDNFVWMLVPEGYNGGSITIYGSKLENGQIVKDYDNSYTLANMVRLD